MKKFLLVFAAMAMLFACGPESPSNDPVSPGKEEGKDKDKEKPDDTPVEVIATAITVSPSEMTVEKGTQKVLTVSFTPSNTTKRDLQWSSSNTSIASVSDGTVTGVGSGKAEITARCGDLSDKCVVTVTAAATGIKLDKSTIELIKGETKTLTATLEPSDATDPVTWESSNKSVATVANGVVTAVGGGDAIITAKAGQASAQCKVTVKLYQVPAGAVDLGVEVVTEERSYYIFFAECNLGANSPEESGDYYAWGDPQTYYTSRNPLKWKSGKSDGYKWTSYKWAKGTAKKLTKYCSSSHPEYWGGTGNPDNKLTIELADDAVNAIKGGKWRMPTFYEMRALCNKCDWTWGTKNGVKGYYVSSKVAGNNNKIFLPAAGHLVGTSSFGVGQYGSYWSSSVYTPAPCSGFYLQFSSTEIEYTGGAERDQGFTIRPVTE